MSWERVWATVTIIYIMKRTVKDVEKLGQSSIKYIKMGLYYLTIPIVVAVGAKTIDFMRFTSPQIWSHHFIPSYTLPTHACSK